MAALKETTLVVVNPGRAVRHDRKRHTHGAVLSLGAVDLDFLIANGDVSLYVPKPDPTLETGSEQADKPADTAAKGDTGSTADAAGTGTISAENVLKALDNVAAAVASGDLAAADPAPSTATTATDKAAADAKAPPAAKKAAKAKA
jgi:hypothetical protein